MKRVTINIGFVTNSSSCIHSFDKRVLEDTEVKAFLSAYGIENGYIGADLWNRATCGSFLVSQEQKDAAFEQLNEPGYGKYAAPAANEVVVIFGDEYQEISSTLSGILSQACERLGIGGCDSHSYN